jgi:valyl-tRNA synthetase
MLALAPWPADLQFSDPDAEAEIGWVIDLITAIRSVRSEMNIPPAAMIPLVLIGADAQTRSRADRWAEYVQRLARVASIGYADAAPAGAVQVVVRGQIAALPLAGLLDLSAETARLQKELVKVGADISRIDAKLDNADFIRRAPEEVVDGEREKREEAAARREKIEQALERLQTA